jgi:hypothetical protein
MEGGSPGFRWVVAVIVWLFLALPPRAARGHTAGLSAASFEVAASGGTTRVEGWLTFATAEALSGIHLDGNHDRVVTPDEVAAASKDLERFVLDGVEVAADGAACAASFEGASIDELDGLLLRAGFDCPAGAARITATLFYLSRLPPAHREVAQIVAGETTAQAVLSGDHRAIELALPAQAPGPMRRSSLAIVLGVAAMGTLAALLARRVIHSRGRAAKPPSR